jgi:hypothetical protein
MIMMIYGEIGAGKTMYAVKTALNYHKKNWYIFTNFLMRYAYVISYNAFINYDFPKNSLIIIDEANIWFSSREWRKLTYSALIKFTQSRKLGYDFIYTTQRPESVDIQLRDITNYFIKLENWSLFSIAKAHSKPFFDDTSKRKYDLGITLFFPKFNYKLFKMYDTTCLVRPDWNFEPMSYIDYFIYYNQVLKPAYTTTITNTKKELSNITTSLELKKSLNKKVS